MGEGKKGSLLPSPVVLLIVYMRERKHKNKCKTKNMTFHQAAANVAQKLETTNSLNSVTEYPFEDFSLCDTFTLVSSHNKGLQEINYLVVMNFGVD